MNINHAEKKKRKNCQSLNLLKKPLRRPRQWSNRIGKVARNSDWRISEPRPHGSRAPSGEQSFLFLFGPSRKKHAPFLMLTPRWFERRHGKKDFSDLNRDAAAYVGLANICMTLSVKNHAVHHGTHEYNSKE